MKKIAAFYPNYFHIGGIAYAALSIIEAMRSEDTEVSIMGIASGADLIKPFYRNAFPAWAKSIAYRLLTEKQIKKFSEFRFSSSLTNSDIVYLWPGASLALYKNLYARGHQLIMESVNTHQATSKSILDTEYARLGLKPAHGITSEAVIEESAKLELSDFVFSCSPNVTASLIAANVSPRKILETTYGLRESEVLPADELVGRSQDAGITAIFVGTIGVRKGPHLILDYWCRSNIKGKLRLVGDIQPEVRHIIEPYLKRSDIEHVPYVKDLRSIYKEADVFILPSLEEGSPLVTYLALGAGLPCIVSPMGGGGVVEHGKEGFVIAPFDAETWIESLKKISEDVDLRKRLSKNAHMKANEYVWSNVGRRRAKLLVSRLNDQDAKKEVN
ncbi:MAG TPA: glycosyltransferase family 4 protein [Methylotenera sp.]|nr:glycosyltransferase family 4 protein [Methylotenera sp.]